MVATFAQNTIESRPLSGRSGKVIATKRRPWRNAANTAADLRFWERNANSVPVTRF